MKDQNGHYTQEQLANMSVTQVAEALMKMSPREARDALEAMPEDRYEPVERELFDKNFRFYATMSAESFVDALKRGIAKKEI